MKTSFEQMALSWLESRKPLVKYSTYCAYSLLVYKHLLPYFGQTPYISERDVQEMVIKKMSAGLSKTYAHDLVAILRTIHKHGARKNMCRPVEWDKLRYPPETKVRKLPILSLAEQRKLMRYLMDQPTARNIGILLAICTGMRLGEICGLEWDSVDLRQRIIIVRQAAYRSYSCQDHRSCLQLTPPKTQKSAREIPISSLLFDALSAVKKQSRGRFVLGDGERPYNPPSYRDMYRRLLRRIGIPYVVFHGLRHTFATRCIESQCDYKTVSSLLGHSTVSTTLNLYVHTNREQKKRALDKMSRLLALK